MVYITRRVPLIHFPSFIYYYFTLVTLFVSYAQRENKIVLCALSRSSSFKIWVHRVFCDLRSFYADFLLRYDELCSTWVQCCFTLRLFSDVRPCSRAHLYPPKSKREEFLFLQQTIYHRWIFRLYLCVSVCVCMYVCVMHTDSLKKKK